MKPSASGLSCVIVLVLSVCAPLTPVLAQNSSAVPNAALLAAADKGDLPAVRAALKAGADANAFDAEGYTALELAAMRGHLYEAVPRQKMADIRLDIVKLLLDKGAKIGTKEIPPTFPVSISRQILSQALYFRHYDLVKPLLQAGADPQAISLMNILHATPAEGRVYPPQRKLFEERLKVSMRREREWAMLDAVLYDDADYFERLLLDSGVDVDARRWDGFTPLTFAVWKDNIGVVKLLLDKKADVNVPIVVPKSDYVSFVIRLNGKTPLRLAEEQKDADMIALLKGAGAHD